MVNVSTAMSHDNTNQLPCIQLCVCTGDAYLAVCGAPTACASHAVQMADMALAARETVRSFTIPHDASHIEMRFGLHSGAVVAGVVGALKMPRYHVFGHTVSVAGKIESASEPMSVNVSETTRNLLVGEFDMQWMGVVTVDQEGSALNRYELLQRRASHHAGAGVMHGDASREGSVATSEANNNNKHTVNRGKYNRYTRRRHSSREMLRQHVITITSPDSSVEHTSPPASSSSNAAAHPASAAAASKRRPALQYTRSGTLATLSSYDRVANVIA